MMLKTVLGAALVGAVAMAAAPASAALTLYTSRAAFEAAIAGDPLAETTIGFGSVAPATGNTYYGAPGSVSVGGDTFTTPDGDNLLFAVSGSPTDSPFATPHLEDGTDGDFTASLTIGLKQGVDFLGFDVGAWIGDFAPTPLFATLNGQTFDLGPIGFPASFFGFTSTSRDIQSLTLSGHGPLSAGTQGSMIDLIDVSQPVPEPASWALMLVGFFGLGATMRRARGLATA